MRHERINRWQGVRLSQYARKGSESEATARGNSGSAGRTLFDGFGLCVVFLRSRAGRFRG
ncbi:MAG: hypothetical protein HY716_10755 [Planctomycetes bacterium]|nr:hypothetical protein [Planctomycetota bacterium]